MRSRPGAGRLTLVGITTRSVLVREWVCGACCCLCRRSWKRWMAGVRTARTRTLELRGGLGGNFSLHGTPGEGESLNVNRGAWGVAARASWWKRSAAQLCCSGVRKELS
jgi:hypothetical protein